MVVKRADLGRLGIRSNFVEACKKLYDMKDT